MLNIHVETADRPSNFSACRQTSRNTSLIKSSAVASLRHHPQHELVDADMVAREQHLHREPIAAGDPSDQKLSEVVCIGQGYRLVRLSRRRWRAGSSQIEKNSRG
jgi:uncharacterized protein YcsI (UPF0317 family)